MNLNKLTERILAKGSFLCIGLDPDINKIPDSFHNFEDPIFEFCKMIIDATREHCVAYKPNTAFFESQGSGGWNSLEETVNYIGNEHFVIADAKRGDLGNTTEKYAEAFFKKLNVDAITLSPYMGFDSVSPYFKYKDKWIILLIKTSNPGSKDFQTLMVGENEPLYINVLRKAMTWGKIENTMFVVGANNLEEFIEIRQLAPHHFILVPGFGAQGGKLKDIKPYLSIETVGILANYSRQVIYAGDYKAVNRAAREIHDEMKDILHYLK